MESNPWPRAMRLASSKEYSRRDFDMVLLLVVFVEQDDLPLSLFSSAIVKICVRSGVCADNFFPTAAGTNASEEEN